MKSIDKKTLILIGSLVVVAALIIIFSQNALDKESKFGGDPIIVSETEITTEQEKTTFVTEPNPTETTTAAVTETTETPSTSISTTSKETTTEKKTEIATKETTTQKPEKPVNVSIYSNFEYNDLNISIRDDSNYSIVKNDGSVAFKGKIKNVFRGETILENTKLSKSKLKKLGFNIKEIDVNNLMYVSLSYGSHEFTRDGQKVISYYHPEISGSKNNSFNLLIYFTSDDKYTIVDINGDLSESKINNFYF